MNARLERAEDDLLGFALSYPESYEDSPWGERVAKVEKKIFVFFHVPSDELNVTVKLPESATIALSLPFVKPTGYGLAKSGWVTATFAARDKPPVDVLKQWIDDSYLNVAPKKLVVRLDDARGSPDGRAHQAGKSRQRSAARRAK